MKNIKSIFGGVILCTCAFLLASCQKDSGAIATAKFTVNDEPIEYFSWPPSSNRRKNIHRPNCNWYFDKLFSMKSRTTYESFFLACSFYDEIYVEYSDKKLMLNIEFTRKDSTQELKISRALVRWSKDGLNYKSTLSKNSDQFGECKISGCQITVHQVSFPNADDPSQDLSFDLELSHALSLNTTTNEALKTHFRFEGRAKHQRPK